MDEFEYVPAENKLLSEDEFSVLEKQKTRMVSEFQARKIETDAKKFWDLFYKRNEDRFFKDRHWTIREFKELVDDTQTKRILLEVGCGVGNFVFPLLLEDKDSFFIYACDFSPRAIELFKSHTLYNEDYIKAFVADITTREILKDIRRNSIDIVTLIFVLSAIDPKHYDNILRTVYEILKPSSIILFRDYGLYDMTQLRFKPGHQIFENFYMRQDGTRSYFFSVEFLRNLFCRNGFSEIETKYVTRRTVNKKEKLDVSRIFIQAKYMKLI